MLLLFTSDLPARAIVCNMKLFSGEYGCSTCTDKGDNTRGGSPLLRLWPYSSHIAIRSERSVFDAFTHATETSCPVRMPPKKFIIIIVSFIIFTLKEIFSFGYSIGTRL